MGGDVEDVVGGHGAGVNWSRKFYSGQRIVFLSGLQDVKFAVLGSHPDFAVGNEGRSPNAGLGFVLPVLLAGLGALMRQYIVTLTSMENVRTGMT